MTDQQLLELAAKAAGMAPPYDEHGVFTAWVGDPVHGHWWDPRGDDGDSFRLACALRIGVDHSNVLDQTSWVSAERWGHASKQHPVVITEPVEDESQRAQMARDVVLRAAAEIGEAMQRPKCQRCHDRGEIFTGRYADQGHWQPPEPIMEPCPYCEEERNEASEEKH